MSEYYLEVVEMALELSGVTNQDELDAVEYMVYEMGMVRPTGNVQHDASELSNLIKSVI